MVVCRCRKATKWYCFVHKAPVCGECISFPEHSLCVVRTYAEWVIDGDYDWPPKCGLCLKILHENDDTIRLGCSHILHTSCLETHLRSFPPHTAPAGYVCPSCSAPVWPPKFIKDGNSGVHLKLKQVILQSEVGTTLLESESCVELDSKLFPPSFSTPPSIRIEISSAVEDDSVSQGSGRTSMEADSLQLGQYTPEIAQESFQESRSKSVSGSEVSPSFTAVSSCNLASASGLHHTSKPGLISNHQLLHNGAMARKNSSRGDNLSVLIPYEDDNEKYSRRGPFHRQIIRTLLPFWSTSLPILPVTLPPKGSRSGAEELIDGRPRRKQRNNFSVDSRKLLLWFAVMSCMATALLLYYRLAQGLSRSSGAVLVQGEDQ